uniref:NADH-ubiquinone oxidoreductase chain 6 n=1 Tax=Ochthebius plesiotypus TaxID=2742198 RepID=A0A7H0DJW0_9COLE|nr:NADH dehydrogenase subunit 6 [Ochthebius plesiotypus]QNP09620.1 NADH dehydrogenase subunit 6 [Ochthebius plesiotypus]
MMMAFLLLNMMMSLTFLFMNHPLSMGMILLLQTILISLITGFLNFNYWFSYILFIIMIGGMLVLFIYMTSVASNEKFKFNIKLFLMIMILMLFMLFMMNYLDKMFFMIESFNKMNITNSNYKMLSKFYNFPSNFIMFMMIIYLFITLIAVVKVTDFSMGPLRQKF